MLGIGILSLDRGGDAENLSLNGRTQVLGKEVRLFERFPTCDSPLRGFNCNFPEWACWNSCLVSEAAHLVWGDLGEAAAVAEVQGEFVVGNIGHRGDKIVARRQDGRAAVGIKEGPVLPRTILSETENAASDLACAFTHPSRLWPEE